MAYWLLNYIKIIDLGSLLRSLTTNTVGYLNDGWNSSYFYFRKWQKLLLLCALILSETLALYKSFTYLLTYLLFLKYSY